MTERDLRDAFDLLTERLTADSEQFDGHLVTYPSREETVVVYWRPEEGCADPHRS